MTWIETGIQGQNAHMYGKWFPKFGFDWMYPHGVVGSHVAQLGGEEGE